MKTKIALILAAATVVTAAYLGAVVHDRNIVPEKSPNVPLPFVYNERHITEWSGLIGGATPDAKPVKTVIISAPAK